jgi:hypothetical protein
MKALGDEQVADFITDGFVKLEAAFPRSLAEECLELLWDQIEPDRDRPETWTQPLVYVWDCPQEPFRRAANTPRLHAAFDQLVGPGQWRRPESLGWFVIRFPSEAEPPDAGWHVDGSYPTAGDDTYGLNLRSRGCGLRMLFLFSDTTDRHGPTGLRVGSHLDIPALLAPYGAAGTTDQELFRQLEVTSGRPVTNATGQAGDVYLCHPFLVHGAQRNRASAPRFMAQPSLRLIGELDLGQAAGAASPVGQAVRRGLAGDVP